ncbi:regulator of G-protein signaling 9-like isoform X5 [Oncorhynchus tshawytscha]|uniref:regulator of G-protein signaling 9-like isoform X5 n=1 Tax=Oncorhynchus tshawytscha TaxID=74940 RepID=UPI001C3CCFD9|nr:regulator of G-protein signaling 9-like isoform X5 [Oncorhynchus tshawytscha]
MTIRTLRDYGQHYRPRMACLKNVGYLPVEVFVVEMQDPKSGVKGADQKLNVTIIPHVINGQDILAWIVTKMKVTTEEAQAFGTMLVAYGYIYPLQNHRKLVLVPDSTLYRFQTPYFWPVQKWPAEDIDYAIYLARRNIRKKGMLEPYEQVLTFDVVRRTNIFLTQALMRSAVKSSVSLTAFVKFVTTHHNHDPFLTTPVPSNPWITDSDEFWQLNSRSVDIPTKLSVERWVLSFWELISDPRGRVDFKLFLKKEHSAENMAFYEAAEEMRWGAASAIPEKSQFIFNTFLKPGAPRWINIDGRTMGLTVKGLVVPHRYVLDAAQTHIFLLMKKDTFYRYLKSPVHKDMQKRALVPAPHVFTDAQLEANVRNRNPGISPILQWQQEEEEKAAAAVAARPIDVKAMVATNKLDRK